MSEVPTPVSESTSVEVVRKEGTALSWKSVDTIVAGELLYQINASGVAAATGAISSQQIVGVAMFAATSGQRVTTIKGKVRALWDGGGSPVFGTVFAPSTAQSGMWMVSAATSGNVILGTVIGTGPGFAAAAANSGLGVVVDLQ